MTDKQPEALAQMLQPGGIVPIDVETTAMLVGEITRQHAAIERKDALLLQALGALDLYKAYGWPDRNGVIPAIKQELSR